MCDSTICFSFIKSGLDQLQTILGGATIGKENRIETVNLKLASNARTQYSDSKTRQKQNNKMRVQQTTQFTMKEKHKHIHAHIET